MNTMQQLTFVRKDLLEWREVETPRLQGEKEALVRPLSVARCDLDTAILRGFAPIEGVFALGHEFVGEITELGEAVKNFQIGQKVVVTFQISCGECRNCRRNVTGSCTSVPPHSMYGLPRGNWGGALSDVVRVPFAEAMMIAVPDGIEPKTIASASDNLVDGLRTVHPYLDENPDAEVLIVGGGAWSVGLYAAAIAVALGAKKVDYSDTDKGRLELAEKVGANPIEGDPPKRLGSYQISVDASANPKGLSCCLRSLEAEGICTSIGIYFSEYTNIPLNEMFYNGVIFKTGRANSRPGIPKILELVQSGKLKPELLTTVFADWNEAIEALPDASAKVIIVR
jgi:threonine dehydrogenase-like Zn-dependent dehydrogenase